MSFYRNQLESWLKTISVKTVRVLDLGGAANPVIPRLKSFQADEYICFDNGSEEAKTQYIKFDINEPLEQLEGFKEKDFKFNEIFCLEVFEYVWNPVEAVRNISRLLANDGIAYVSFPSIYPVHNPENIDYLRYTKQAIIKYVYSNGMEIHDIVPRVATEGQIALSSFYSLEGMHPLKNSILPFDIGYMVKIIKPFLEEGV